MAGTPIFQRYVAVIFITTFLSSAQAAFEDCRLEAIDMVAETAAARCDQETTLLGVGDTFRGYSVTAVSSRYVTLSESGAEGATVLWYAATEEEPSRVRRLMANPPEQPSRERMSSDAAR